MNPRMRAAIVAAAIVILDRVTKIAILDSFPPHDVIPIISGIFNIVHAENPGAAFSMLAEASPVIRKLVLTAAAIATLGTASLTVTATPASAHHWGGGGYHHGGHFRGFGFYAGGYDTCLRRVWVVNRHGYSVPRTINVCD